jgi:hypothetical protein
MSNEINYICRGPRTADNPKKRKGCGFNLTKLIGAVPVDGKSHEVPCPKCKEKHYATNEIPAVVESD